MAVGSNALYSNTTGWMNNAFGFKALYSNTTGNRNNAFGLYALYSNTTGSDNVAMGYATLQGNTTGYNNVGMGAYTLYSNSTGYSNTAIGKSAMNSNQTGYENVAIGELAVNDTTSGAKNTGVGYKALAATSTGDGNTGLGHEAGKSNTTGSNNTYIGYQSGQDHNSGSGSIFIGVNACSGITSASNFFCLGGASPMMYGNATRLVIERDVRINGDLYVTGSVIEGDNAGDDAWDSPGEVAGGASHDAPEPSNLSGFQVSGNTNQGNSSPTSGGSQDDSGEGSDGGFNPNDNVRDSRDDPIYARNDNQEFSEDDLDQRDERDDQIFARNDQDYREDDVDRHDDPDVPDDENDNSDADPWDSGVDHQGDLYKPKSRARSMSSEEYALLDGKINELDFKYETLTGIVMETQERLREGFAMSAAIAARPTPNEYGFHFTAGAGNYESVNALSMGFIYAHEDFTISVGHAKSDQGGPTMTNIGFSYNLSSLFKKKK